MAARLIHQWRDQLEGYWPFLEQYPRFAPLNSLGMRRERIRGHIISLNGNDGCACRVQDAEHLRRYFDAKFNVPTDPDDRTLHKYDHLEPMFDLPQPKKASSIMDNNLAALLRSDARTVHVRFKGDGSGTPVSNKTYTYVTHLTLEPGDTVVVDSNGAMKLAEVKKVDDEAKIEPGCSIEYKWVIGKVDFAAYEANEKRNADIVAEAAVIVRNNMRKSFAQQVLGAASEEQRTKLLQLTGNAI